MEEAGSVKLTCITNSFSKQLHHLTRKKIIKKKEAESNQIRLSPGIKRLLFSGSMMLTDLVIGNEGNTVVNSHSTDEEVIPHMARVVVGQVHHQVDVALVNQSIKTQTQCHRQHKELNPNLNHYMLA